jgi:hypothetical protein
MALRSANDKERIDDIHNIATLRKIERCDGCRALRVPVLNSW